MEKKLFTLLQKVLPHHALSQAMSYLTHNENKTWKNFLIRRVIHYYGIDISESLEQDLNAFASFNKFFVRELKPETRPLTTVKNAIACPADGIVSQAGIIHAGKIIQAKGKHFTAVDLLGGDTKRAAPFHDGTFSNIYLAPRSYHRLHMPLTGTLCEMVHIPGRLFSVNRATTNSVQGLFAKNERVVAIFDTEIGKMALVLVGAIFVSSIETVWHGVVTPPTVIKLRSWTYNHHEPLSIEMGHEMGRFNMGSTIIVLFEKDKMQWCPDLQPDIPVKVRSLIGTY